MDPIAQYEQTQRESWVNFGRLQSITTPAAARLVRHARVEPGARLRDAGSSNPRPQGPQPGNRKIE